MTSKAANQFSRDANWSASPTCTDPGHRERWSVIDRNCNYSAFNGYARTSSDYSKVTCGVCGKVWRTKAAYVATLPDWSGHDGS